MGIEWGRSRRRRQDRAGRISRGYYRGQALFDEDNDRHESNKVWARTSSAKHCLNDALCVVGLGEDWRRKGERGFTKLVLTGWEDLRLNSVDSIQQTSCRSYN